MGAEVVAWDDNAAARAAAADVTLRDPCATGRCRVRRAGAVAGHSAPPADSRIRWRRARVAAGVPILSDAELLFQAVRACRFAARFAGITGTNGKSTTTALLAHILDRAGVPVAAGGNLGTAALALPLLPDDGMYVLEMSSYMLERIATLRFDAAAMLNLSADHLDRHGDMAGYAAAKRAIFDRQQPGRPGRDRRRTMRTRAPWRMRCMPGRQVVAVPASQNPRPLVGLDREADQGERTESFSAYRRGPALPGAHNAQNAAAAPSPWRASSACRDDTIAHGFASFPGLPHRQQRVGTIDGITFINDSKATNADAAARALACYDRLVWIAGGMAKEGGIEPLAPFFPRIARALLIGRDAPMLAATLAAHSVPYRHRRHAGCRRRRRLRRRACRPARPVVLLSPACASWDQFTGFDAARRPLRRTGWQQLAQGRAA